jgi:hypothetical protein
LKKKNSKIEENNVNDKEHKLKLKRHNTNSHINHFLLVEKQNPFNERRSSCASVIIKWITAKFIIKVPREKQNGFWARSISKDIDQHDCSQAWG